MIQMNLQIKKMISLQSESELRIKRLQCLRYILTERNLNFRYL